MSPFDRVCTTTYSTLIETIITMHLSCILCFSYSDLCIENYRFPPSWRCSWRCSNFFGNKKPTVPRLSRVTLFVHPKFSRFDTIPACDSHTHTDTQTHILRQHNNTTAYTALTLCRAAKIESAPTTHRGNYTVSYVHTNTVLLALPVIDVRVYSGVFRGGNVMTCRRR